jgi:hypothetical protein
MWAVPTALHMEGITDKETDANSNIDNCCRVVCPRGTFFVFISASFERKRVTRTDGWKDI